MYCLVSLVCIIGSPLFGTDIEEESISTLFPADICLILVWPAGSADDKTFNGHQKNRDLGNRAEPEDLRSKIDRALQPPLGNSKLDSDSNSKMKSEEEEKHLANGKADSNKPGQLHPQPVSTLQVNPELALEKGRKADDDSLPGRDASMVIPEGL